MHILNYIFKKGIKHTFKVIYIYKFDIIIQRLMGIFLKYKPLKDIIVIESHNDFDSNGGALYQYLIKNNYNKRYKIVWAIKHLESIPQFLPDNVDWYAEYKPGIKKNYYKWVAKWFSYDMDCGKKLRKEQISIFLTHGSLGLKNCQGVINLPDDLNYCLASSEYFAKFEAMQYSWMYPNDKFRFCGFPAHDVFYSDESGDLKKVTDKKFKKIVLWMPTFRRSISGRCDGSDSQPLGLPLFKSLNTFHELSQFLGIHRMLLIIKIHPKQDLSNINIINLDNIRILTGKDVKDMNIDNYRLMKDCDALISDYSSVAHEFLHLQKPIAFDLSDLNNYSRGLIVEDPRELIAGHEIRNIDDFFKFLSDVSINRDPYINQRQELFGRIFKYLDGGSSERVVKLLGLQ